MKIHEVIEVSEELHFQFYFRNFDLKNNFLVQIRKREIQPTYEESIFMIRKRASHFEKKSCCHFR